MEPEFSVEIDPYQLDQEWVEQAGFYHRYAIKLAEAKYELDHRKATVDVVRAEMYQQITSDPQRFGLSKTTEAAIANAVLLSTEYQLAVAKLNEAKHAVNVLEAAVAAIDQKKRALENLVTLFLQDYYSKPNVQTKGRESREKLDDMEKDALRGRVHERARRHQTGKGL